MRVQTFLAKTAVTAFDLGAVSRHTGTWFLIMFSRANDLSCVLIRCRNIKSHNSCQSSARQAAAARRVNLLTKPLMID